MSATRRLPVGRAVTLWAALCGLILVASACSPSLPEPDSPGAKLYAARCNHCHRLYAPKSLKFEMWKMQIDRMQGEFVRRGIPPLTADEVSTLHDYLRRFGG